jgi:hypothetical protein
MNIRYVLAFINLISLTVTAQITDSFSDGNLKRDPTWVFEDSTFVNKNGMLQSNSSNVNSSFFISTSTSMFEEMEWSFWVKLDFATSSANYCHVHLIADSVDINQSKQGYILSIGGTKDDIKVLKNDDGNFIELFDGEDKTTERSEISFKILYSKGKWTVLADFEGGINYIKIGQISDTISTQKGYFGFNIRQSSNSFHKKHFIDDVYIGHERKDTTPPSVASYKVKEGQITLNFNEVLAQINSSQINLLPNYYNPDSITQFYKQVVLYYPQIENGAYTLHLKQIKDTFKNQTDTSILFEHIGYINPTRNQILITEVLFNPNLNGTDFIELYNNSEEYVMLDGFFSRVKNEIRSDLKPLIPNISLPPKSYLVFCSDSTKLLSQHPNAINIVEQNIPPMNNDKGILLLLDSTLNLVDSISYSESQHFELLNSFEEISLERTSFIGESTNKNLWHSAASTVGFASPGFKNSQNQETIESEKTFSLQHQTVSPDNDGYEDLLTLNFSALSGYVLNAYVFNLNGKLVHHAFNNQTLHNEGSVSWNCVVGNGSKIPVSNYILLIEAFDLNGKVIREKKAFSVVARF